MKLNLLKWLACPECAGSLSIQILEEDHAEIVKGLLSCGCGNKYQIIEGIPRMLTGPLQTPQQKATQDRFGYEWTYFSDYDCDNFEEFIAPLPHGFFRGKTGLDAGCGAGRHIEKAGRLGAEMIGVDLSEAVCMAYQKNRKNPHVHIVQADINRLPFRQQTFDFIYSLGVLHHLPDPRQGYERLIPLLKKNGAIFIWLYAHAFRKTALEILRAVSLRLSNANIRRMAFICALVDFGIFINCYRLLQMIPGINKISSGYAPLRIKEYASHGFKVSYTDWFDRLSAPITNYYTRDQAIEWTHQAEITHTQVKPVGDSWWWIYGERKEADEYPDRQH